MKKKSVIAGAIAAGLFFLIIILCVNAANNPKRMVTGALVNTARDVSGIYLADYANKLINGGSVTVTGNLKPLSGRDADAELKVFTDFSRMRFAATGKIKEGKTPAASFRGAFNGNDFSFESPQISNKPYGVSLRKLSTNLPKSVFNPETGEEDVRLSKNTYEYLMKLYKTVSEDKSLRNEGKRLLNDYERYFVNALLDNARITTGSEKISAGGQQIPCTVVTLDFDRKSLVNAVSEFVTCAKHDRKLESYLLKCYSNSDYGIKDADDMVDDFYEKLDAFKRTVKNYDGDMTVWIYISRSGKRIARIDVDTDGKNMRGLRVDYEMSLELGKNVKNSEEISFELESSAGPSCNISYSVRQNDKTAYKASLTMSRSLNRGRKTTTSSLSFKWDKRGGGYTLTLDDNGRTVNIEGRLKQKGDTYECSLDNLEKTGGDSKITDKYGIPLSEYGIRIVFDSSDRAFNPSRYVEITRMSAEDYKALRNDVKRVFSDTKNAWFVKH